MSPSGTAESIATPTPRGKYVFAYLASPSDAQLAFNTTLVNPKEFKSYWDVTQPKWKGKIVSLDLRDGGLGGTMQFFYYNPELGPEFIKKVFWHHGYPVRQEISGR